MNFVYVFLIGKWFYFGSKLTLSVDFDVTRDPLTDLICWQIIWNRKYVNTILFLSLCIIMLLSVLIKNQQSSYMLIIIYRVGSSSSQHKKNTLCYVLKTAQLYYKYKSETKRSHNIRKTYPWLEYELNKIYTKERYIKINDEKLKITKKFQNGHYLLKGYILGDP